MAFQGGVGVGLFASEAFALLTKEGMKAILTAALGASLVVAQGAFVNAVQAVISIAGFAAAASIAISNGIGFV
jgi:hypothetical protein